MKEQLRKLQMDISFQKIAITQEKYPKKGIFHDKTYKTSSWQLLFFFLPLIFTHGWRSNWLEKKFGKN